MDRFLKLREQSRSFLSLASFQLYFFMLYYGLAAYKHILMHTRCFCEKVVS